MFEKLALFTLVLRAAVRLDVFDITYEHSNEALAILELGDDALPRKGVIVRVASYLSRTLKFARVSLTRDRAVPPGRVAGFYAASKNEFDSLSPIARRIDGAQFIGPWGTGRSNLNMFKAHVVGLLFLPLVVVRLFQSSGYRRASFAYAFDQYLLAYGMYLVSRLWLVARRPACIVVANHLAAANRSLLKAARDERVPTLYFLHATISDVYPTLDVDFALLEGMDTLKKYDVLGSSAAKVFLVGMAKHDRCRGLINKRVHIETIGVCVNGLDPTQRVEEVCRNIAASFPQLKVVIRPHPADRRYAYWRQFADGLGFEYSDWKNEGPFDFLARVDVNIAGDSGIHLEAALLNVLPLYYDFNTNTLDLYSFRRNGLVDFADDIESFNKCITRFVECGKPECRDRAKSYCATVGTDWDWRSAELSFSIFSQILQKRIPDAKLWRRVPGVHLEAYEVAQDTPGGAGLTMPVTSVP